MFAVQADPWVGIGSQRSLDGLKYVNVIVRDDRHRRERQAVVGQGAFEQRIRRIFQRQGPDFDQGAVDRQRADHAQGLRRALGHQAGEQHRVLRGERQYFTCTLATVGGHHRLPVGRQVAVA